MAYIVAFAAFFMSSALLFAGSDQERANDYLQLGIAQQRAGKDLQARTSFSWASAYGNPDAQYRLAMLLESGPGRRDTSEAERLCAAAAQSGHVAAQYAYAYQLERRGRIAAARPLYQSAADQNYAPALNRVGEFLEAEGDLMRAYRLYLRASEQHNIGAFFNLGRLYEHGSVVAQDLNEAVRLYELAAERDYRPAFARLGELYLGNRLDHPNRNEAIYWLTLAGTPEALNHLRQILEGLSTDQRMGLLLNEVHPLNARRIRYRSETLQNLHRLEMEAEHSPINWRAMVSVPLLGMLNALRNCYRIMYCCRLRVHPAAELAKRS